MSGVRVPQHPPMKNFLLKIVNWKLKLIAQLTIKKYKPKIIGITEDMLCYYINTANKVDKENDFEVITKKYKALARKHHPDMPTGDHTLFQKINAAHKLIRKELS